MYMIMAIEYEVWWRAESTVYDGTKFALRADFAIKLKMWCDCYGMPAYIMKNICGSRRAEG